MAVATKEAKFEPGQWVLRTYLPTPERVQILEDMGCLGVEGEHIFRVLVPEGKHGEEEFRTDASEADVIRPA